jgi:flagellar protein FlaG
MTIEFGTIKAALPSAVRTSPAEPARRGAEVERALNAPGAAKETGPAEKEQEPLDHVVSDLNSLVRELHRELQFSVDDESGDTVIKVIDLETDEVVRQIPSEEAMRMRRHLQETTGVIFQDSA